MNGPSAAPASAGRIGEVSAAFLRLGCTSFGGPVAHLGYFHEAFVRRRGWLDEAAYAELVGLCQFLPGPASSQLGFLIGYQRAGVGGALAAWVAFTAPSAALMIALALGAAGGGETYGPWLHGVKVAVVAVVAQAVWALASRLCPDARRAGIALAAAAAALLAPGAWQQVLVLVAAGAAGLLLTHGPAAPTQPGTTAPVAGSSPAEPPRIPSRALTAACWALVAVALAAPLLAADRLLQVFGMFARVGALVFGGGHVVLPLLQAEVVQGGWLDGERFLAGYGLAQLVSGPMFSLAGFLGAALPAASPAGALGAGLAALAGIFLPGLLMALGALRGFHALRASPRAQRLMAGLGAGVVGLLLAACYDPVLATAVLSRADAAIALLAFLALAVARWPSVAVVPACAVAARLWSALG
jgi:chromate transporter